jgi:hypothetical protein
MTVPTLKVLLVPKANFDETFPQFHSKKKAENKHYKESILAAITTLSTL